MVETARLGLPLVQAGQAQKHVTVNSAFERIDALTQLVLVSRTTPTPPVAPAEGSCFAVPTAAVNDWNGQEGRLALFLNGGWDFVDPVPGWRGWVADEGIYAVYNGNDWIAGAQTVSPGGAAFIHRVIEFNHAVATGPSSTTPAVIPSGASVFAVTGRVLTSIGGTATSFRLGVAGESDNRYGSGIGISAGSWLRGVTSSPLAYFDETALTLTAEGGAFDGGVVRLCVHLAEFSLPDA